MTANLSTSATSSPAAVTGTGGAASVRVASYNVLSDSLCRASHYVHSAPGDLENGARLLRVKAKLQEEMDKGAVICLQEVRATA
jgi:mRNA deadenylase 3'-5' endonuclease subunit Ccr4